MVEQVNNLIFNLLISGRGVFLPGVGSLFTRFNAARLLPGRKIERGVREVIYPPQERGVSIVEAIAEAAACDRAEAADIYDRWLARTLAGDVLTVGGVGVLRDGRFMPEPAMDRLLNPGEKAPVVFRRASHRLKTAAFAVAVVCLAAAGYFGYMRCPERCGLAGQCLSAVSATAPEGSASASADEPGLSASSGTDGEPAPAETGSFSGGDSLSVGVPQPATDPVDSAASAALSDGAVILADSGPEEKTTSQTAAENPTSTPQHTAAPERDAAVREPMHMVAGRTYLVLGVYSTPENARRSLRETAAKNPDVVPEVYFFGEKFMVSIGTYPSREEAAQAIRAYGGRFKGVWPYSKK